MIKIRHNIYLWILLLAAALVSCNQEEAETILGKTPQDVPEGFMKVTFSTGGGMSRAELKPVNGADIRIQHLQYVIYQKQQDGSETTYGKDNGRVTVFSGKTSSQWPYPVSIILPKGEDFRIVFLGNVDKSCFDGENAELLTLGDGNYSDARIHAPSNPGGFNDNNLYYWANVAFDTKSDENSQDLSATLQRIVSQSVLTTQGIPEGFNDFSVNDTHYYNRYYRYLISQGELNKAVFGEKSQFVEQLRKQLEKDLIYPIAYMLNRYNSLSGEAATWLNGHSVNDFDYPHPMETTTILNNKSLSYPIYEGESGKALSEFVNSLLYGDDVLMSIANSVIEQDKFNKVTSAKNEMVGLLSNQEYGQVGNYAGIAFPTFDALVSKNTDIKFEIELSSEITTEVDFDLNSQSKSVPQDVIALSASAAKTESDCRIAFSCLAPKDNSVDFAIKPAIKYGDADINYLPTEFLCGQTMLPNIRTCYRLVTTDLKLGDKLSDKEIEINLVYGKLVEKIDNDGKLPTGITADQLKNVFKFALSAAYDLYNSNAGGPIAEIDNENCQLSTGVGQYTHKMGFNFRYPDFSTNNLSGTLTWETE